MKIGEAKNHFEEALNHFIEGIKKLRTGRANPSMLDSLTVMAYGRPTPLHHVASVGVVDGNLLQISPYDPNNLELIVQAIRSDEQLGLNPSDDGRVVRVPIPPMTTERREEVVKILHDQAEQARIAFRNIRHEILNTAKQQEKDKEISVDEMDGVKKQSDDFIEQYQLKLDQLVADKEAEILRV